jgi:hypothetical protein
MAPRMSAGRSITPDELAKHNSAENNWIVVHGKVFDVTKFAAEHPGGKKVLTNAAGKVRQHHAVLPTLLDFLSLLGFFEVPKWSF